MPWKEPPQLTPEERASADAQAEWLNSATHEVYAAAYRACGGHPDLTHSLLKQAARMAEYAMIGVWSGLLKIEKKETPDGESKT